MDGIELSLKFDRDGYADGVPLQLCLRLGILSTRKALWNGTSARTMIHCWYAHFLDRTVVSICCIAPP